MNNTFQPDKKNATDDLAFDAADLDDMDLEDWDDLDKPSSAIPLRQGGRKKSSSVFTVLLIGLGVLAALVVLYFQFGVSGNQRPTNDNAAQSADLPVPPAPAQDEGLANAVPVPTMAVPDLSPAMPEGVPSPDGAMPAPDAVSAVPLPSAEGEGPRPPSMLDDPSAIEQQVQAAPPPPALVPEPPSLAQTDPVVDPPLAAPSPSPAPAVVPADDPSAPAAALPAGDPAALPDTGPIPDPLPVPALEPVPTTAPDSPPPLAESAEASPSPPPPLAPVQAEGPAPVAAIVDTDALARTNARIDELEQRLIDRLDQVSATFAATTTKATPESTDESANAASPNQKELEESVRTLATAVIALQKKIDRLESAASTKEIREPPRAQKEPTRPPSEQSAATSSRPKATPPAAPAPVWIMRGAQSGQAWLSKRGEGTLVTVRPGDTVDGLGTIRSIAQVQGRWLVTGSEGSVSQ